MRVIDQSVEMMFAPGEQALIDLIERAGRTCYKSESLDKGYSGHHFVRSLIRRGHLSVIEHANVTVKFITNRGVTHELVRHRLAAYSQESTRWCNYGGKGIQIIRPVWLSPNVLGEYTCLEDCYKKPLLTEPELSWLTSAMHDEKVYEELLSLGWRPEQAREVLPNALKAEIVTTMNIRMWRHVVAQRCGFNCHPQMRALMGDLWKEFSLMYPILMHGLEVGGKES